MKTLLSALALLAEVSACGPRAAIPAAAQFSASTAEVGKALLPKVERAAQADISRQRREALAAGMKFDNLPEDCNGFFTVREGVHFRDCPDEAPIRGFKLAPTVQIEALSLLKVYLAFGDAVGVLAKSTAPKDTADAIAKFAKDAGALAKELEAAQASESIAGLQGKMAPLQQIAQALLDVTKAKSLCGQMKAGREAFYGAHRLLWIFTQKYVVQSDSSQPFAYFDAKDAGRPNLADAGYTTWKKTFGDSPFARLDAAAASFDATLTACGRKP